MNAISVPNRTIYDCNLFQKGRNMIVMSKSILESRGYDFWTNLAEIVRFGTEIAFIFDPLCYEDCNHIYFSSLLSLQSYLTLFMKIIAIIFGPALYWTLNAVALILQSNLSFSISSDFCSSFSVEVKILCFTVSTPNSSSSSLDNPSAPKINSQKTFCRMHSKRKTNWVHRLTSKQY